MTMLKDVNIKTDLLYKTLSFSQMLNFQKEQVDPKSSTIFEHVMMGKITLLNKFFQSLERSKQEANIPKLVNT